MKMKNKLLILGTITMGTILTPVVPLSASTNTANTSSTNNADTNQPKNKTQLENINSFTFLSKTDKKTISNLYNSKTTEQEKINIYNQSKKFNDNLSFLFSKIQKISNNFDVKDVAAWKVNTLNDVIEYINDSSKLSSELNIINNYKPFFEYFKEVTNAYLNYYTIYNPNLVITDLGDINRSNVLLKYAIFLNTIDSLQSKIESINQVLSEKYTANSSAYKSMKDAITQAESIKTDIVTKQKPNIDLVLSIVTLNYSLFEESTMNMQKNQDLINTIKNSNLFNLQLDFSSKLTSKQQNNIQTLINELNNKYKNQLLAYYVALGIKPYWVVKSAAVNNGFLGSNAYYIWGIIIILVIALLVYYFLSEKKRTKNLLNNHLGIKLPGSVEDYNEALLEEKIKQAKKLEKAQQEDNDKNNQNNLQSDNKNEDK